MAQTSKEGYDCGNRGWLSKEEILQISDSLWDKPAADAIMFHQFASVATQTMIRPEELLQLRRRNTWLSESSDYNAKSGSIKLMEILSKGENKNSKTSRLLSWVVRNRELDHMCPWFWVAARLMHDYQRMQPGTDDGHYGTMVQVFQDRPKGDHSLSIDVSVPSLVAITRHLFDQVTCSIPNTSILAKLCFAMPPIDLLFCSQDAKESSKKHFDREDRQ